MPYTLPPHQEGLPLFLPGLPDGLTGSPVPQPRYRPKTAGCCVLALWLCGYLRILGPQLNCCVMFTAAVKAMNNVRRLTHKVKACQAGKSGYAAEDLAYLYDLPVHEMQAVLSGFADGVSYDTYQRMPLPADCISDANSLTDFQTWEVSARDA
eukprot:346996-Amphidinium_carterae.1